MENIESIQDYDLDTLIFRKPLLLLYTKSDGTAASKMVSSMSDVANLLTDITNNNHYPSIGGFSIDWQLWFALARHLDFFKSVN
jgi:hypothetical protein